MFKHCEKGLAALGAGISMLVGSYVANGIGRITGAATAGVTRQPEAFERIRTVLLLGSFFELLVLFAAIIIAVLLLRITLTLDCRDAACTSGLATVGAAISILSGIGACIGIATAFELGLDGVARQPEAFNLIISLLGLGDVLIIITLTSSVFISICLIKLAVFSNHNSDC